MWSQVVIFLPSWDEVWESSLILHTGYPTDSNNNRDANTWVTLGVFSVTVMKSELLVLLAGRGSANHRAVRLRTSTRLAGEPITGFYILNQLMFREREREFCCILWWFGHFKQSSGSWGLGYTVRAPFSLQCLVWWLSITIWTLNLV